MAGLFDLLNQTLGGLGGQGAPQPDIPGILGQQQQRRKPLVPGMAAPDPSQLKELQEKALRQELDPEGVEQLRGLTQQSVQSREQAPAPSFLGFIGEKALDTVTNPMNMGALTPPDTINQADNVVDDASIIDQEERNRKRQALNTSDAIKKATGLSTGTDLIKKMMEATPEIVPGTKEIGASAALDQMTSLLGGDPKHDLAQFDKFIGELESTNKRRVRDETQIDERIRQIDQKLENDQFSFGEELGLSMLIALPALALTMSGSNLAAPALAASAGIIEGVVDTKTGQAMQETEALQKLRTDLIQEKRATQKSQDVNVESRAGVKKNLLKSRVDQYNDLLDAAGKMKDLLDEKQLEGSANLSDTQRTQVANIASLAREEEIISRIENEFDAALIGGQGIEIYKFSLPGIGGELEISIPTGLVQSDAQFYRARAVSMARSLAAQQEGGKLSNQDVQQMLNANFMQASYTPETIRQVQRMRQLKNKNTIINMTQDQKAALRSSIIINKLSELDIDLPENARIVNDRIEMVGPNGKVIRSRPLRELVPELRQKGLDIETRAFGMDLFNL